MFFNESLYLEDEDLDVSTEETMSDDEIKEAADSSFEDPLKDGVEAVEESYEFMLESQRNYYNLREKMMKLEHMAIMKNQKGLCSEASALLNEAKGGFLKKIKGILKTIKDKIIALWHKVMGFFKNFAEGFKKKVQEKTGTLQIEDKEVETYKVDGVKAISVLMTNAKTAYKFIDNYVSKLKDNSALQSGDKEGLKEYLSKADLELDKAKEIEEKIKEFKADNLVKEKVPLTKQLIQSKIKVIKLYNNYSAEITKMKEASIKEVDAVDTFLSNMTEDVETSLIDRAYKASTNAQWIFSVCTNSIVAIFTDAEAIGKNYIGLI